MGKSEFTRRELLLTGTGFLLLACKGQMKQAPPTPQPFIPLEDLPILDSFEKRAVPIPGGNINLYFPDGVKSPASGMMIMGIEPDTLEGLGGIYIPHLNMGDNFLLTTSIEPTTSQSLDISFGIERGYSQKQNKLLRSDLWQQHLPNIRYQNRRLTFATSWQEIPDSILILETQLNKQRTQDYQDPRLTA
jgi:hypothetical protein